MLLECWNEIVASRPEEIAFRHPERADGVAFSEIDGMSRGIDVSGGFVVAVGNSVEFFPSLIAAWRAGKPALLVENKTSKVRKILTEVPAGTLLIKQTCGASGIERSLFFSEDGICAEGRRNIVGLGLHAGRRGVAAVSLAHSYGFGCLALPLLMEGIPLEIVGGPLPMQIQAALDRGGEVFLPGVPAIWKTWWQTGVAGHPAISLALCAGSPLSLELEHGIHAATGLKVRNFYGTSETGAIAYDGSDTPRKRQGFVGRALAGINPRTDKSGRILVTSDSCATGTDIPAWDREFEGDYLTLDQGEVSEDGIFVSRCIGRAINVAGRKVSPDRLRTILESLPGVKLATVERGFSRDFERFEEIRVRLMMQGEFDKKALREELRQKVESWEMPRSWEFEG